MPTPSPNQPPDHTSPPPYGLSTCPDDQPHGTRPARQAHDTTRPDGPSDETNVTISTDTPLLTTYLSEPPREDPPIDGSPLSGGQVSIETSSRGTTLSPRPLSSGTLSTSPIPSGRDGEGVKHREPENPGNTECLSRESSAVSSLLHTENVASMAAEADSFDDLMMQEDEENSFSMGTDYPNLRSIPVSPSSFLRSGSKFHGTQQSERQVYDVQVEIKHVDMRESFLCGYLRIQGLTEDHPTLTTYFEGEIIGTKYNFFTKHDDWGANTKVDLSHWSKFGAFRPFQKSARKGPVIIPDAAQRENIFMRWKEHFLVPDHRVRTITGASFEGFYYICFNQIKGEVSGIYFHSKSEKFQQLELKHVPDRGCFGGMEFR